jgi:hypothetical protein
MHIAARRTLFLGLSLVAAAGCKSHPSQAPADTTAATPPPTIEGGDLGTILLTLTTVPQDVKCMRVMVTGNQTVTRTFDVAAGATSALTLAGLPVGQATVYEETFNVTCATLTPNTPATWVAEAPVPVVLLPTQQTSLICVLRRPAGLSVSADFRDGAGTVTFTPTAGSYGDVLVNNASTNLAFSVNNLTGSAVTTTLSFTGPDAAQFAIVGGTCAGSVVLQPGGACIAQTVFTPASLGVKNAVLTANPALGSAAVTGNGVSGIRISLTPNTNNFGSVVVGDTSPTVSFTATNTSSLPAPAPVTLTGANAGDYQLAGGTCAGLTGLPANGTCTVLVRFAPLSPGAKAAFLNVGMPAASADLSGLGVAGTGVTFMPPMGNYATTCVGCRNPLAFTITNPGTAAVPLSFGISGPDAGDFFIEAAGGSTCLALTSLDPGASCTVAVDLTPSSVGPKMALLSSKPSFGSVALTGAGALGTGSSFTPMAEDFGSIVVGQRITPSHTLTLTSLSGGGTPTFQINGPDRDSFLVVMGGSCGPISLRAGDSCTVLVRFSPKSAGPKKAYLADLSRGSAVLTGIGISGDGFDFDPPMVDYGQVVAGALTSPIVTIKMTNISRSERSIFPRFSGPDANQFQILPGNTCEGLMALGPGESCMRDTRFLPKSPGVKTAAYVSGDGDPTSAPVTGTAISGPGLQFTPPSVTFPDTFLGLTSGSTTFTVLDLNTAIFNPSKISLGGTDPGQFKITGGTCPSTMMIGPNETCTVTVAFTPSATGAKTATLSLADVAGSAALQGNGVAGAGFSFAPPTVDLGDVLVNDMTKVARFTVTNIGAASSVPAFSLSGANANLFQAKRDTGTCPFIQSLPTGMSCTQDIAFLPRDVPAGVKTATLGTMSPGTATITANVLNSPGLTLSPTSVDYGVVGIGSFKAVDFTATNSSSQDVPFPGSSPITGTNANQFGLVSGVGTCANSGVVLKGSTCTFQLKFAPTSASGIGAKSATASIGGGPPATLTGTAVVSAITALVVNDTSTVNPPAGTDLMANSTEWSIQSNFSTGVATFGDRAITISSTGNAVLNGKPWIRTAADSKLYNGTLPLATFKLTGRFVYLLVDDRHNGTGVRPPWLDATFIDQNFNATMLDAGFSRPYSVYRKDVANGSTVTLPKINSAVAPCYIVVIE